MAAIFFVAFAASRSEVQRLQAKFSYMDAWQYATHAAITADSVVVLGDSITANAPWPSHICGHPIVKAGYGGAGADDFLILSRAILKDTRPGAVVVALGANDIKSPRLAIDYRALLMQIAGYTETVIAVSNTADPRVREIERDTAAALGVPYRETEVTGLMPDRVHFNADGYRQWMPVIAASVCRSVADAR